MDDDAIVAALTRAVSRYRFERPVAAATTGRVGRPRLRLIGAGVSVALVAGLVGALLRPSLPFGPSTAFADWQAGPMTPTAAVRPFADIGLPLPDCPAKSLTTSRFKDSRKTSTPTETQKSEYIWNQSVYMENIDH